MSEQLPPVEPVLRRQLTRRSAGTLPSGLLALTLTRLDEAPRRRWAFRLPRTIVALGGIAVVAVLALTLIFVPSLQTQPATGLTGYPTDRALTTAELAALLTDTSLPVNTVLVANVTIGPVDSAGCLVKGLGAIGQIQGLDSRACVVTSGRFDSYQAPVGGDFAFRYLGGGILGLIGAIAPASSSRLAFDATGEWPREKAFLVEGYLGATELTRAQCDAIGTVDIGDVLNPSGYEQCRQSWLSEDGSPAPVSAAWGAAATAARSGAAEPSASPSMDWLAAHEKARYVMAGGARQIDSIPLEATRGVYVVEQTTGPCPDASPVDSRGCAVWQVLAKVADVSLPSAEPTSTSRPTVAPLTGYPTDRALAAAELADLMAGPALTTNTTFVATVTIDVRNDVCPMNRAPTIGVIEDMPSQVCAMDQGAGLWQLKAQTLSGTYVFQYWAPGYLAALAEVTPASPSRLAFLGGETWPASGSFLVESFLHRSNVVGNAPDACPGQTPDQSGSVSCGVTSLSDQAGDTGMDGIPVRMSPLVQAVAAGRGVFLVTPDVSQCPSPAATDGCRFWRIDARLDDDPFAAVAAPTETPPPTGTPPATVPSPTPLALPTTPAGAQPLGLWGSGNRPFTVAELPQIWAADPNHLANRIVIVKGPVPSGISCTATENGISTPGPCDPAVEMAQIAPEGYWAVKVGSNGKLTIVGQLALPSDGGFSFTGGLDTTTERLRDQGLVIVVDGWLAEVTYDSCAHPETPPPNNCQDSKITGIAPTDPSDLITPQVGAYQAFTGAVPDVAVSGPPVRGFYLVLVESPQHGTLLGRLATVQP